MMELRKSAERGHARLSWLESRHSFSFGSYYDPDHIEWGSLRVLNEDWIAPGQGFGPHPHRDMEILTVMLEGELEHRDSQGGGGVLTPGSVQLMRAGRGIVHSEMNPSLETTAHLLQIWIQPAQAGLAPGYWDDALETGRDGLVPIATAWGAGGGMRLEQDASLHAARLAPGAEIALDLRPERRSWVQWVRGSGAAGEARLEAGDAVRLHGERSLRLTSDEGGEALVFDLA